MADVSIVMGPWGTIYGACHPFALSQSTVSMWSVNCLPKAKFSGAATEGFIFLNYALAMVRSLAWKVCLGAVLAEKSLSDLANIYLSSVFNN